MKLMKLNKRVIAALMAVLMIAAMSTVSVFAVITPGDYFYQYINGEYEPTPMGSQTVRSYYYDADADKYYVDFQIMDYRGYKGFVKDLTVNDGSGASIVITDAFEQYYNNAPVGVNMNTYLGAYTGTTHTLVYSAASYGLPLPLVDIVFEVYDPSGNPFPHPALTNPYIALQ